MPIQNWGVHKAKDNAAPAEKQTMKQRVKSRGGLGGVGYVFKDDFKASLGLRAQSGHQD